jgi:hypothetical protein
MVKLQQIMCSVERERERERERSKSCSFLPEYLLNNLVADRGNGSRFGSFFFRFPPSYSIFLSVFVSSAAFVPCLFVCG